MKIRDVMTKELIKTNPDSELEDAMNIMITKGIRRLVVGDLLGIVTVRDLVYGWLEGKKRVKDVMTTDLLMISPDLEVRQATKIMTGKGVGSLLVYENDKVVGIVTERDLLRSCRIEGEARVGDVMKVDPVISSPDASVMEVANVMKENWERHAIVVEESLPAGVISIRDIAGSIVQGKAKSRASEIMRRPVYRVTPDSLLETARTLMSTENIGYLPVVDSRTVLGSVEEREILAVVSI